ncbi:uncharacterized [Tachysurus ichikawai]
MFNSIDSAPLPALLSQLLSMSTHLCASTEESLLASANAVTEGASRPERSDLAAEPVSRMHICAPLLGPSSLLYPVDG